MWRMLSLTCSVLPLRSLLLHKVCHTHKEFYPAYSGGIEAYFAAVTSYNRDTAIITCAGTPVTTDSPNTGSQDKEGQSAGGHGQPHQPAVCVTW